MKPILSPVVVAMPPPPPPPGGPNQIFWLWTTGGPGTPNFPRPGADHRPGEPDWAPQGLDVFLEAIATTRQSILILDPFFDLPIGLRAIWDFLPYSTATEIKILTTKKDSNARIMEWLTEKKNTRPIEIRKSAIDFHDRFAALDGELWHFGSTVGGAFPKFSATTRGWSSNEFREVFMRLWKDVE